MFTSSISKQKKQRQPTFLEGTPGRYVVRSTPLTLPPSVGSPVRSRKQFSASSISDNGNNSAGSAKVALTSSRSFPQQLSVISEQEKPIDSIEYAKHRESCGARTDHNGNDEQALWFRPPARDNNPAYAHTSSHSLQLTAPSPSLNRRRPPVALSGFESWLFAELRPQYADSCVTLVDPGSPLVRRRNVRMPVNRVYSMIQHKNTHSQQSLPPPPAVQSPQSPSSPFSVAASCTTSDTNNNDNACAWQQPPAAMNQLACQSPHHQSQDSYVMQLTNQLSAVWSQSAPHIGSDCIDQQQQPAASSSNEPLDSFNVTVDHILPGMLANPIPDWLLVYAKADLQADHLLQWHMFQLPQLEFYNECLMKQYKQQVVQIVIAYERYRLAIIEELRRRRRFAGGNGPSAACVPDAQEESAAKWVQSSSLPVLQQQPECACVRRVSAPSVHLLQGPTPLLCEEYVMQDELQQYDDVSQMRLNRPGFIHQLALGARASADTDTDSELDRVTVRVLSPDELQST